MQTTTLPPARHQWAATGVSGYPLTHPIVGQTRFFDTFCHFIHFFANPAAADEWTAQHSGTFTIQLADGSEIARLVNRGRYPSIFSD